MCMEKNVLSPLMFIVVLDEVHKEAAKKNSRGVWRTSTKDQDQDQADENINTSSTAMAVINGNNRRSQRIIYSAE